MLHLSDIMTRDVLTLAPDITVADALEWFSEHHISGAPVVSGGRVVGVVSLTDLATFVAALPTVLGEPELRADSTDEAADSDSDDPDGTFFTELWEDAGAARDVRFANVAAPKWNILQEHTVEEAMTREPIHELGPETTVTAAANFLRGHDIHRVLVTKGPALLGIVTTTDIAQAVAQHRLAERTYVFGHATDADFNTRGFDRRR